MQLTAQQILEEITKEKQRIKMLEEGILVSTGRIDAYNRLLSHLSQPEPQPEAPAEDVLKNPEELNTSAEPVKEDDMTDASDDFDAVNGDDDTVAVAVDNAGH